MSMVASIPPPSLSHNDLYVPSGSVSAHAELPPTLPSIGYQPLVPFPIFQHSQSSPYPQSFSALGAPEESRPASSLDQASPPAAPRLSSLTLPSLPSESSEMGPPVVQEVLPPTPDPSPPTSKMLFPTTMVKLAPPAEDGVRIPSDETPRRLPLISIESQPILPSFSPSDMPGPSNSRVRNLGKPPSQSGGSRAKSVDTRQMRRSITTANVPTAVRMTESRSADARARLRSGANMLRGGHQTSGQYGRSQTSSPSLARALTEGTTPTHSQVGPATPTDLRAPDLGDGVDGLEAKVVLLGSQGVGKTSLILRYTSRTFSPTPAAATIGTSLYTRKLVHAGVRVKLQIWDTAGQERFRSMAPIYYRGAHVCVLVYDVADRTSFDDVRSWLEELGRTVPKETMIFVVGAKIDLGRKRVVSLDEARRTIQSWLKPPPPPPVIPPQSALSPSVSRNLFRNPSVNSRAESSRSALISPTPTRSQSHNGLVSLRSATPSTSSSKAGPSTSTKLTVVKPVSILAHRSTPSVPFPALKISSPTSISFPTLQSPTSPTFATNTENVQPKIIPASAMRSHRSSAGRFSFSGVLGYGLGSTSKPEVSVGRSGAASNLARMVEENDVALRYQASLSPPSKVTSGQSRLSKSKTAGNLSGYLGGSTASSTSDSTPSNSRVRTESSPLFSGGLPAGADGELSNRRKSEDWSSRSWRMGEGPGAAETLGEFGEGVKRRGSGELLSHSSGGSGSTSTTHIGTGSGFAKSASTGGRSRGGSLGRDSRLYPGDLRGGKSGSVGEGSGESGCDRLDGDCLWGVDVEGIKLGECSALTGEGVDNLFKSISSVLVDRKDKIERERILRHRNSVMLTDPKISGSGDQPTNKWGGACCT